MSSTVKASRQGSDVAQLALAAMGGKVGALAGAAQVSRATVYRWLNGDIEVSGTTRVALFAIIKHPDEYRHFRKA